MDQEQKLNPQSGVPESESTPPPPPPPKKKMVFPPEPPKKGFFQNCLVVSCCSLAGAFLIIVGLFVLIIGLAFTCDDSEEDLTSKVKVHNVPGFPQETSDYIAVIPVHGVIMNGETSHGIISPKEFSAMMEKAEKDQSVKAVIISIDSPGGEVNAADEIYRTIVKFREKTKRPVIAMMRSIAASGGYYIAAGCDKIVASDMTLTGSIGVIISSYNVTGLLDKIGVKGEVYKSGKMKDMLSPTRPRTPEEQKIVQELVEECYDKFAGIVSRSRKIPLEKIKNGPIGDGRVYHGKKALSYGMVDKIGNLEDAVALCEEKVKIKKLSVKTYHIKMDVIDMLLNGDTSFNKGLKVEFQLPGKQTSLELKPGRLYYLPAGL